MAKAIKESAFDQLLREISFLLLPLTSLDVVDEADRYNKIKSLFLQLGWQLPEVEVFLSKIDNIISLSQELKEFVFEELNSHEEDGNLVEYSNLIPLIKKLIESIQSLDIENVPSDFPENLNQLPKRLLDYLIINYLITYHPKLFSFFSFIGIIEVLEAPLWPENLQQNFRLKQVRFERIPKIFISPLGLANSVYQWESDFDLPLFLSNLELILRSFYLPGGKYLQEADISALLGNEEGNTEELRIPIYQEGNWPESYTETGVAISPANISSKGFAVLPYLLGSEELALEINEQFELVISLSGSINGLGIVFLPDQIDLIKEAHTGFELAISVKKKKEYTSEIVLIGSPSSSRFSLEGPSFSIFVSKKADEVDLGFTFNVEEAKITIRKGDGDGFLQKILPNEPIEVKAQFLLGFSYQRGFFIEGSGGLEFEIKLNEKIGPLTIDSLNLGLLIREEDLSLNTSASFSVMLGPINTSISKMGLKTALKFNEPGLLGEHDLAFGFLPPTGAGLSVAVDGLLIGGGFLDFNYDEQRYSGLMALQFLEFGVTAVGLITTKMPDGSKGFSMLIDIGITFEPPFQLAFGFTLNGVGGLVGINRSMQVDVLQAGIRTGDLNCILFPDPKTVVANADHIISVLRSVFPPEEGHYVVGPMVKIGWGSNLLVADVGVFLEFSDQLDRISLLGQVEVMIPTPDEALVSIHLDVMGSVDFERGELTFKASLYDSYILIYQLAGDAALLLRWGDDPEFALSIGGFHPSFQAPDHIIFKDMRRLSMSITYEDLFSLTNESYYAITSNSFQFGARSELYVHVGPLEINGFLGYDALFYFDPFSFIVAIEAGVSVSIWGWDLLEVYLALQLSGPTPWNARGVAGFTILGIDYDKDFNYTWGEEEQAVQEAVDPWPLLQASLENPDNWGTYLPNRQHMMVTLRDLEEELEQNSSMLLVHPLSTLELRQRVCPLNMRLEKFANSPVKGHDEFKINGFTLDGNLIDSKYYKEYFAPGQFLELTDDERLSKPSFEKFIAGIRSTEYATFSLLVIGQGAIVAEQEELIYESDLYNSDGTVEPQLVEAGVTWGTVQHVYESAAKDRRIARADSLHRLSLNHRSFKVNMRDAGDTEKGIVESLSSETQILRRKPAWRLQEETYRIVSARDFKELGQYQEETLTTRSLFREAAAGKAIPLGRTAAEQRLNRHLKEKRERGEQPEEWLIVPEIMPLL